MNLCFQEKVGHNSIQLAVRHILTEKNINQSRATCYLYWMTSSLVRNKSNLKAFEWEWTPLKGKVKENFQF